MVSSSAEGSQRIAGSFRDPSGYVFERAGRIYRAIDAATYQTLRALHEAKVLSQLIERQLVVGTRFVTDEDEIGALAAEHPNVSHFLAHDRIAPITYPYEWSLSMLADAALHTLELQMRLLESGFSLKDATAYNIQFRAGRPVFIDLPSIERPARLDVWYALGQFAQMFTFPLLLCRYRGWDLRSYFLGSIGGRDVEQTARALGRIEKWLPRNLLDVTLPLLLHRRAEAKAGSERAVLEKPNQNYKVQLLNLERLRNKIRKLAAGYKPHGVWADYTQTCSYDDQAEQAKKALVQEYLRIVQPARVLDMGCNTGAYSYLAAAAGASVIAADADHDAVELLYRRLKAEPAPIAPMVLDLSNPSPAIGYRNAERPSFFERLDVDCVLALALLHHLHVSGNLSIPAIRDQFAEMTAAHLILEFVPTDDVMFQKLMKFRVDLYHGLTLEGCRNIFAEHFTILREDPIAHSPRTLLLMKKKV